MKDFIEVFYSNNPYMPYYAIVWRSCTVVEISHHARLLDIARHCAYRRLPVVCTNEQIRDELKDYQIVAQSSLTRAVGEPAPLSPGYTTYAGF